MNDRSKPSRRDFLKTSAVAGAALAGGLSLARSVHAAGSDKIKVALIGCGGRGSGAIQNSLDADPAIHVIAVADAFEKKAQAAAKMLQDKYADRVDIPADRVFVGLDAYQKAIATDCDMIITATPPGFRPLIYAAAIKAGKNVFMEKPCCVDAAGYRSLMETNKLAAEKNLKVGVGFQRRHTPSYIETINRIHDGAIGKLMFLRAYWNGSGIWNRTREELAKTLGHEPTEMEYQVNNWYHFCWLSGDNICEQHIHNLDVSNWVMTTDPKQPAHPVEANGMGGCSERYLGKNKGTGQIFDHHFVEFTYADGTKLYSQCRHMANCFNKVGENVHGTEGESDPSGSITAKSGEWKFGAAEPEAAASGRKGRKARAKSSGPNLANAMVQEHKDLAAAIRNDQPYHEGWHGAASSMTAVLGRIANYTGQVVNWDELVAKGGTEFPQTLAWDATPPVVQDKDGNYPIPMPGIYKAF